MKLNKHYIVPVLLLFSFYNSFSQLSKQEQKEKVKSILETIILPSIPENRISLLQTGGKGNGSFDNKKAFDKALMKLQKKGGGTLVVPKGNYRISGPIHLINNLNLHLAEGATLKFGSNTNDYPLVYTSWEGTFIYNYSPFIYGYNLHDIAITGKGTIDGEAATTWLQWKPKENNDKLTTRDMNHNSVPVDQRIFGEGHYLRPQLVQLINCNNILVEDVRMEDSPFWCLHLLKCKGITIRGVSYDAHNKNNDGIDLEYSSNVLIENVTFNNGDDNIAIKAGRDHEGRANAATPSKNIVVRNCLFKGLHALVIGSEMSAGVENVFVENSKSHGYVKRGIYFKTNRDRGGYIKDIYIENLSFDETEDLIYMTANYHGEGNGYNSKIKDIEITNVQCNKASGTAIVIQGYKESKVENVLLSNITVEKAKNGISVTNTQHVTIDNVIIGEEATLPTAVK
ncbi:glycoside hydrolase [Neptunitalea chrysea]|uniref:Glycoside hydrolase n=1 Tax=Neptunitalea chrysea TaxID=1647581 RepID=A0A9W6B8K6_9FLAO|nr:glycoside hydrolase family 28 protein [Neptunitalea chrysea]GLB53429.1 glycoside hydrolase [Neptunitalea chrysea]